MHNGNVIIAQYPAANQLIAAPSLEVERVLLRHIVEYCADGMHPMVTRDGISNGLFDTNGYPYSPQARADVARVIGRVMEGARRRWIHRRARSRKRKKWLPGPLGDGKKLACESRLRGCA